MHDDHIFRFTGTRLAFLAIVRRVRNALGLPRCNCPDHGGTGGRWAPCPCTSATGAGVVRTCPHVTLRPSRVFRHASLANTWGFRVNDAVFAQLTPGERLSVEADSSEWDGAPEEDDE